jgi:hypothetical protein
MKRVFAIIHELPRNGVFGSRDEFNIGNLLPKA